jgi:RimJ/RimL family protein N-acetyltransferase
MSETRTKRRKRNRAPLPPVEVRTDVTLEQVHTLWDAIVRDPSPYYVSDYTPRFFHDLVGQLGRSVVLLGGFIGGELAGGLFITRMEAYPDTSKPLHAVVDMYICEPHRGKGAFALARAWKQYLLETIGFETFYATIHPEHKASQYLVTQMGMYRVGIVPSFIPMQGKPQDMVLFSMKHPQKVEVPGG